MATKASDERLLDQFTMICLRCDRPIVTTRQWIGREQRCPHCYSVVLIPEPPATGEIIRTKAPRLGPKMFFHFACPRCGSLLEAHTGMCGQRAHCPTCAAHFEIPGIKRSKRPAKARLLGDKDESPSPMHAFAADGAAAPKLVRTEDDQVFIECPKCHAYNEIDVDACAACHTPFTLEGATSTGKIRTEGLAQASLLTGVFGLLTFPLGLLGLIAILTGSYAMLRGGEVPGRAIAGVVLGVLATVGGAAFWYAFL